MTDSNSIRPHPTNPIYWEYNDHPVRLLGGSIEDNLFQIENLQEHLNLLEACGGNYVRCTMSSRDDGDVWPYSLDPDSGLYDLNQPNPQYWQRFSNFMEWTFQREIIIQIECCGITENQ